MTPSTSKNLIQNPGFEDGFSLWNTYTNGEVTFSVVPYGINSINSSKIDVANKPNAVGTNTQLYQIGIVLEPYTEYELSFDVVAYTNEKLWVSLFKHDTPYTNYGVGQTIYVTTVWTKQEIIFTTTGFTNVISDARLSFMFAPYANPGAIYYIDNIQLIKIVDVIPCVPNWQCELPLNGYESDDCGNRQYNEVCEPYILPTVTNIIFKPEEITDKMEWSAIVTIENKNDFNVENVNIVFYYNETPENIFYTIENIIIPALSSINIEENFGIISGGEYNICCKVVGE